MRRRQAIKRVHQTDPRFNSELVAKVIRTLMKSGKKTTAERIVYGAIEEVAKETGKDPLEVMDAAINNMKPKVEVKSRRVGGATYPVPVEIRPGRQLALALRWMAQYASARRGVPMPRAVALELIDAYNNTGNVLKKRDDTHKMAQANKAFALLSRARACARKKPPTAKAGGFFSCPPGGALRAARRANPRKRPRDALGRGAPRAGRGAESRRAGRGGGSVRRGRRRRAASARRMGAS